MIFVKDDKVVEENRPEMYCVWIREGFTEQKEKKTVKK